MFMLQHEAFMNSLIRALILLVFELFKYAIVHAELEHMKQLAYLICIDYISDIVHAVRRYKRD